MATLTDWQKYEKAIADATDELVFFVEAQTATDFKKLTTREKILRTRLVSNLLSLPFKVTETGKVVLDITKRGPVAQATSRLFALLAEEERLLQNSFGISDFNNDKLQKLTALQMKQVNAMATRHWNGILGALNDPSTVSEAVFAEAKATIKTTRLLRRKLNLILGDHVNANTYGKFSNIAALASEA